jgi:hypothetical protein
MTLEYCIGYVQNPKRPALVQPFQQLFRTLLQYLVFIW